MKRVIKFLIILAILACCGVIYFKFIKDDEKISYLTTKPIKGDFVNAVIATGEVFAQDLVDVGSQVSGQIEKLYVNIGDKVKKGDLIAQIDSVKQRNEIEKKKAQHDIYMADLNATEISANIAKTKLIREQNLYKKNATSKENLENIENEVALKMAQVTQIKAQIKQNQIDLDTAMTNLSYTKIVSPLDGTVVSTIVKEGQTLNANQTTPLIVQIADLTKLEINMEIAEGDLPKIKKDMRVRYSILSNPDKQMQGVISSIDPAMTKISDGEFAKKSTSSINSSNSAVYYYAKIIINNPDDVLKIGMTTQNSVIIDESLDTIYLPKSAIHREDNKTYLNILVNNESKKQEVTLGISDGFYQEILSGIDENTEVILDTKESGSAKVKKHK